MARESSGAAGATLVRRSALASGRDDFDQPTLQSSSAGGQSVSADHRARRASAPTLAKRRVDQYACGGLARSMIQHLVSYLVLPPISPEPFTFLTKTVPLPPVSNRRVSTILRSADGSPPTLTSVLKRGRKTDRESSSTDIGA